ncbi:MAG: 3-deoxy-manno-octulosonate cytidylyltransferase [Candidatus Omnitrophica bacterium]|nr:3-deoxy-manno-octulosonate cytidylyltransferase [Candidatus Omnitrophota bacterium]
MKAVGVLPARWASTRLPGKVLVDICGKPLVQHVWERVRQCKRLSEVIIACDESNVLERCKAFGANAVLTSRDHPSGSDRVSEATSRSDADIIVNIQADEPLIDPVLIDDLVLALENDEACVVATPIKRIGSALDFNNPNIVKVVVDVNGHALYFSRAAIPFKRDGEPSDHSRYFRHLGLYAYRRDFLFTYCQWSKSFLEQEECLEQLRILEAGYKIKCVETDVDSIGVDTHEDVQKVINLLRRKTS